MVKSRPAVVAALTALFGGSLLGVPAAGAVTAPEPTKVAKNLVSPLSMAVASDGTAYVAQNFAGLLTAIEPGVVRTPTLNSPPSKSGT